VFFKARQALDASSLPSCTIIVADLARSDAPMIVNNAANEVIAGTPEFVGVSRRVEVSNARAAFRYIKLYNLTSSTGGGGILAQSATVTLYDCVLEGNTAVATAAGGAILASDSTVRAAHTARLVWAVCR
jgi:hypothetical protein